MRSRLLLLLAFIGAAAAWVQPTQGQVDAVGFATTNGPVIREGQWIPIIVTLRSQGSNLFSGELRVQCVDLDGDRVAFRQPQVVVGSETGGQRRFWCYALVNLFDELPASVEVIGPEGELVAELPLPPCQVIGNDALLILDISNPNLTALDRLELGRSADSASAHYRDVVIARMAAADLPDRWWGLEAVNIVVWDRPDPSLLSIPQRDALVEWVRNGGQLILGVGPTWAALRKSDLAPLLPLEGDGPTAEVRRLDRYLARVGAREPAEFGEAIAVTTATPALGAFSTLRDQWSGGVLHLVTMRNFGSGRVVATAAALRDLTQPQTVRLDHDATVRLFRELFDLNSYTAEFKRRAAESTNFSLGLPSAQYGELAAVVSFGARAATFGLIAFLFVGGYIGIATVASWWWLGRRRLTHLSWTVFAGFAVAASALSLVSASTLRGFTDLHSLSILDLEAGSTSARGFCMFGYRSPTRQTVDLTLPGEGNFLRPLARDPQKPGEYYVTPARYNGVPAKAGLSDVLVRATLKQVEGWWQGDCGGSIRGDLVVDGRGRLTPASWLANDLPMDLNGGLLLFIDPRIGDAGDPRFARVAGLTDTYPFRDPNVLSDLPTAPPAWQILAVRVPPIAAGKRAARLGEADYVELDKNLALWSRRQPPLKRSDMPDLRTLWDEHQECATRARLLGPSDLPGWVQSAVLASTRNYYLPCRGRDDGFSHPGTAITTARLHDLDLTHWLIRGQAVLLAWTGEASAAHLHRNGKPLAGYDGATLYRVRIPISESGRGR